MHIIVKLSIIALIIVEVILTALILYPPNIHKNSVDMAWYKWRTNPSMETEIAWKRESGKLQRDNIIIMTITAVLLCINTAGIIIICRYGFAKRVLNK